MKSPEAAWLLLCGSVALHVLDEAVNDFLAFYNPFVESISWLPMPAFSFGVWITGLVVAILIGVAATSSVTNRVPAMRWIGIVVGMLMVFNGLGHATLSVVQARLLPGTLTAPLLILAGLWVVNRFWKHWELVA